MDSVSEPTDHNVVVIKKGTKKRWLILVGALAGEALRIGLELGLLGPQVAGKVREVCAALPLLLK